MSRLHPIVVMVLLTHLPSIFTIDVTYKELEELDAVCHTLDTCTVHRTSESLSKYTCHCSSDCSELGTCCVDSHYRVRPTPRRKQTCRSVNGLFYFMVDQCPSGRDGNSKYESMCKEDFKGDLMSLVPVTSLSSNVTYKNYFCLRCNEATEKLLYWNIRINVYGGASDVQPEDVLPTFDGTSETWTAAVGKNGDSVPVTLLFEIPDEVQTLPKVCVPNVISKCSTKWQNESIKDKCEIYTSYIYILKNGNNYRNPHCALCNFEDLEGMGCGMLTVVRTQQKRPFSFTQLLDINRKDGDEVGMIQRCDQDATWDPYFKKCRTLTCALPGHKVKGEKCVPH